MFTALACAPGMHLHTHTSHAVPVVLVLCSNRQPYASIARVFLARITPPCWLALHPCTPRMRMPLTCTYCGLCTLCIAACTRTPCKRTGRTRKVASFAQASDRRGATAGRR
eukprot:1681941-Pleurochrysis_carterae.AAC.2